MTIELSNPMPGTASKLLFIGRTLDGSALDLRI